MPSGVDPYSLATSATTTGLGALQTLIGSFGAHKAQKQLENMQSPVYGPNKSILDYYDKALQRYQTDPTQTAAYKLQSQTTGRNLTQGLSSLTGRGAAVGGTSRLVAGADDAALKAQAQEEAMKSQELNQLGSATDMKAGDQRLQYQYNDLAPFERKYNLLALKAGAKNQIANAGINNVFNGLSSYNDSRMIDKMYN